MFVNCNLSFRIRQHTVSEPDAFQGALDNKGLLKPTGKAPPDGNDPVLA